MRNNTEWEILTRRDTVYPSIFEAAKCCYSLLVDLKIQNKVAKSLQIVSIKTQRIKSIKQEG